MRLEKTHYELEIGRKIPATLRKSFKVITVIGPSPSFILLAASKASLKLTYELDGGNFRDLQRHFLRASSVKSKPWWAGSLDRSIAS